MSSDYVFTMYRADKFYGPDRQVLANISLSFLPGAKIGVLGPNGAGKSTLLRIMALEEEPSSGIAELAPGASVGLLEQEPWLDPEKDVRGNVEDGVRALRDLLDTFNEISTKFAEPDADFDALLAEQAKVQDAIDRADAWQLDDHLDHAMDALRLPDGDRDVTTLSGGERRRVARMARALPRRLQGHRRRGHARPLLPRQRRRLDPRARPRQGYPLPGQLLVLAGAEAGAARAGGQAGVGPPTDARARARVGARKPACPPRQGEGAPRRLRAPARRGAERQAREGRDPHPAGPAPRRRRDRGRGCPQGLRRAPARRRPHLQPPAGGDRRRGRPQRRRQDDAFPDDRGRGAARRRHAPSW